MVHVLDALELLGIGEVLEGVNERAPNCASPEVGQQGAAIQVAEQGKGTVHLPNNGAVERQRAQKEMVISIFVDVIWEPLWSPRIMSRLGRACFQIAVREG